jgi:hypothetical protein
MRHLSIALTLLALLPLGCMKPKQGLSGTYIAANGATLTIEKSSFTLKAGTDTIKGDTSMVGDKLWLHPKTLNDRDEEAANLYAMDQASKMGVQTDMEIQGTIFEAPEFTVADEGKTLTVTPKPKLKDNRDPFYNALGTLKKS